MSIRKFVDKIDELKRLPNSGEGNPRFRVTFYSGVVRDTKPNAAVNYSITNTGMRDIPVEVTTEDGRIVYVNPVQ